MATAASRAGRQRALALALLLAAGILGLPIVAVFLDGESTENLIVPVQLAVMAVLGAVIGHLLPGVAGADSSSARGAVIGSLIGIAAALLGAGLFFLLL